MQRKKHMTVLQCPKPTVIHLCFSPVNTCTSGYINMPKCKC